MQGIPTRRQVGGVASGAQRTVEKLCVAADTGRTWATEGKCARKFFASDGSHFFREKCWRACPTPGIAIDVIPALGTLQ